MVLKLFKKWLPWRFLIRQITGFYGFLDPVTLMARLRQFSKPSEVQEPIELDRSGTSRPCLLPCHRSQGACDPFV